MPPRKLRSKPWDQWNRLVVNSKTPKTTKLKYTTSDLAPLNIKLVSDKDTDDASWFEPWDKLDKLTLAEPQSLNKLLTLDLEAVENLDMLKRHQQRKSFCIDLWYAIDARTSNYSDRADLPRTDPGVSLSMIRPWLPINGENEFYKVDQFFTPGHPFIWGWYVLSLEEMCVRDRDFQETLYPHLQMAIFSFDCPDEDNILASELSALVQIIGIRSRQPAFSDSPNIAALLIFFFGARQVRVIQASYSKGTGDDGGNGEKEGEPKLTVTLQKAIDLAGNNQIENEERMDEIIRWRACNPSF
ncbi:uncharacterized protein N7515_000698 [Penicillium bovifimosum]|uniref:Uncharacterized protein n=1 Tax=Penicillium bovifimosum TaxID=126998 RepID=A0A9W9HGI0_9EURO|nr:uncharacterized protein N7515_000698 [Penicillium bovifimosum]KAJ5146134.1 hypothetical protein N7515_000698 [Penicillium bovifimosum]